MYREDIDDGAASPKIAAKDIPTVPPPQHDSTLPVEGASVSVLQTATEATLEVEEDDKKKKKKKKKTDKPEEDKKGAKVTFNCNSSLVILRTNTCNTTSVKLVPYHCTR